MYATAAARSDGLLLLCGGRDAEGIPLGDAYGLARHRDGRWEWAAAPGRASEHYTMMSYLATTAEHAAAGRGTNIRIK